MRPRCTRALTLSASSADTGAGVEPARRCNPAAPAEFRAEAFDTPHPNGLGRILSCYQEMPLTVDTRLVYGGLRVRDAELGRPAFVDMDTRFSLVYVRRGEDWIICHGHQSLPYTEQAPGEFYPRTLIEQVREARHLADRMCLYQPSDGEAPGGG